MKIKVAKALLAGKHEVVGASRNGEFKVNLETRPLSRPCSIRIPGVDAVISCAGNAALRPFVDLTNADYELAS